MTDFKNIKFTGADVVKLCGFLLMTGSMWYDLKTQQVETKKDMEFMQYQIDELKHKVVAMYAVKPKEVNIESDEQR